MSGLMFSLGGKLDPSLKASLNQAAAESEAAGLRIQNSLRTQISGLDKQLSKMNPLYSEFAPMSEKRAGLQKNLLMVQNAQFLAAAKGRIAMRDAEAVAAKAAEAKLAESAIVNTGRIAGLNLVLRESIVLLREWGRGNYARMPGSASLVAQGLSQMGATGKAIAFLNKPLFNNAAANAEGAAAGKAAVTGMAGALVSIPLVTMAIVAVSLAAIIGAPFIYFHRVKKLAEDLATTIFSTFKPEHLAGYLSKLEILNQLHKDMADSARQIQEAHDSVGDSIQRELDLTRDRISFERELLEIQKANELAAVRNPAEREAIEKKYSALITANKKKERDAEVQAMKDEAKALPGEIADKEAEIKRLTDGDFVSKGRDDQIHDKRKDLSDQADAYFKPLDPGDKDTRTHSADKDRATINSLDEVIRTSKNMDPSMVLTHKERAELDAAKARMSGATAAQKYYNDWIDSEDGRERARQRVDELKKKVQEDSDRLTKLGPGAKGEIADKEKANLQKDKEDLALEQERLKRVDAGRPLSGREVTERERVGFGSPQVALLDVNRSMDRKLGILVQHAQGKTGTSASPLGIVVDGFGD